MYHDVTPSITAVGQPRTLAVCPCCCDVIQCPESLMFWSCGWAMCLTHEDLVVSWGGFYCGKKLWHVCSLLTYAYTCTCTCRLFLRLQLCVHLRLHWVCTGLHVSAGFHCVCTCVAFVFTPALHLHLHWCCHAASVAMVLHLGCTCVCIVAPALVVMLAFAY